MLAEIFPGQYVDNIRGISTTAVLDEASETKGFQVMVVWDAPEGITNAVGSEFIEDEAEAHNLACNIASLAASL